MESKCNLVEEWLPSFPAVGLRVLQLLMDVDISNKDLADTIRDDPAITAKILNFANSPLMGSRATVGTIEHAISWLGKSQIAAIVLSFSLSECRTADAAVKDLFSTFWRRSYIAATALEYLAKRCDELDAGQAYISGILMTIGRLAILDACPTSYPAIAKLARESNRDLYQVEAELLGVDSVELSRDLLANMHLPTVYRDVAGYHKLPVDDLTPLQDHPSFYYFAGSVVALALSDFFCESQQGQSLTTIESVLTLYFPDLEPDATGIIHDVREQCERKAEIYNAKIQVIPSNAELLTSASQQLLEVEFSNLPTPQGQICPPEALESVLPKERKRLTSRVEQLKRLSRQVEGLLTDSAVQ